jgi:energy-coupling factor transporter ATP-binding protein EcfA2
MLERHFIILDEPFSGLDPVNIANVINLINGIAHEHTLNTFIIITHDVTSALAISDHVYLLGRERDAQGEPLPGSRVMKEYDLIAEGWPIGLTLKICRASPSCAKRLNRSSFLSCEQPPERSIYESNRQSSAWQIQSLRRQVG